MCFLCSFNPHSVTFGLKKVGVFANLAVKKLGSETCDFVTVTGPVFDTQK